MRIDLCRAERCVPQKLLHRTEVRTGVEQVRRETVPQAVDLESGTLAYQPKVLVYNVLYTSRG